MFGCDQTILGTSLTRRKRATLRGDPFAEISVAEFFKEPTAGTISFAKSMIVDQR